MKTFIKIFICAALLGLAACNAASPAAPATNPPASVPAPTAAEPTALPGDTATSTIASQVRLSTITASESGHAPDYTLKTSIPVLASDTLGNDPRIQGFNKEVMALVQPAVDQFRKDMTQQPATPFAAGSFFSLGYKVVSAPDSNILSLQLQIEGMMDGAAHPYHVTLSLNYDLEKGRKLNLADLFLPGANALQAISDLCRAELSKRDIGFDSFASGADPTPENYAVWNLGSEGLMIVFNEYQVAPYAAGPQTVTIPLDQLSKIIDPAGPLAGRQP